MKTPEQFAKHENEFINAYKEKGYTASYRIADHTLIDLETKKAYTPEQVYIVAEHRYEGMSNPDDMSILYVLKTAPTQGTYLMAYGPSANSDDAAFFNDIPKANMSDEANILKDK